MGDTVILVSQVVLIVLVLGTDTPQSNPVFPNDNHWIHIQTLLKNCTLQFPSKGLEEVWLVPHVDSGRRYTSGRLMTIAV
ncbi:hypothetical protein BDN72DRAFT_846927 [Pluteus cervinus]|uniref:Uncharacterized protein n=1 Tax=Pluteus cervinus TaxID=181527 RepID=A0ACD3AFC7_9AGAR|nr:hypothetical protein BDN72DRAFT_846927 [Pluteus cervinus]